jgi:hypothetical protein
LSLSRWLIVLAAAALLLPPSASAHVRSGTIAVDYRTRVFALPLPLRRVISARIYESDRAVRLTVAPGHTAVVLGYLREPFLRVVATGAEVNASAPTAGGAGLLIGLPLHSVGWERLSDGRSVTWHDNRVRALPRGIERARWQIPVVADGQATRIEGELWRVRKPVWWPWLVMGVPFVAVSLLLFFRWRSWVRSAAAAFGLVAGAALIASGAGFAFDTYASGGKWLELGNELAFVIVGLIVIARGSPNTRAIAGGALGLLGLAAGAVKFPVFVHGVVLSISPANGVRALVALTIWAGTAATALGLFTFEEMLDGASEVPQS